MNRAIRILTGGWLSSALSHFTRGWFEGAVVVPSFPGGKAAFVEFRDKRGYSPFRDKRAFVIFRDKRAKSGNN